jgi:hypothetical protein
MHPSSRFTQSAQKPPAHFAFPPQKAVVPNKQKPAERFEIGFVLIGGLCPYWGGLFKNACPLVELESWMERDAGNN